jgi:hypothetical protein
VELPGIEPASQPGNMDADLQARSVSFRLSTARYLRFHSRVLTASRRVTPARFDCPPVELFVTTLASQE